MAILLLCHRITDWFHTKDNADTKKLTAIIKTFERPYAVKRLVKTIKRRYPSLHIIVVDDSKQSIEIAGVEYV